MVAGQFCFIADKYYEDFPERFLMRNKESVDGISHRRPSFLVFPDSEYKAILWLVPISSQYAKYKALYDVKVKKYGKCNTIRFGKVLGIDAAFLIQNMCPVTEKYIAEIYIDKLGNPVRIDDRVALDVVKNAREVIARMKRGTKLIFPDVLRIRSELIRQIDGA